MAYPRHRLARSHKFFTHSAGDLTLNSTAWADLPTIGTTWDITLLAQAGDTLEAFIAAFWNAESAVGHLSVATIVGGVPVNYFTSGAANDYGVASWAGVTNAQSNSGGPAMYTVVSGDLSGGMVTCRLRYRTSAAVNKTLYAQDILRFQFGMKNLGPPDPN